MTAKRPFVPSLSKDEQCIERHIPEGIAEDSSDEHS